MTEEWHFQKYVPLHCHTDSSILDGYQKPYEYADLCEKLHVKAAAIADHGTCSGQEPFDRRIIEKGYHFKPIFGEEAYLVDDVDNIMSDRPARDRKGNIKIDKETGEPEMAKQRPSDFNHGCIWAKTNEGLANLWTLSTLSYTKGMYYKPRIDMKMLKQYGKGLFVSDGCMLSAVSRGIVADDFSKAEAWLNKLIEAVGKDNVLMELHTWQFTDEKYSKDWKTFEHDELKDLIRRLRACDIVLKSMEDLDNARKEVESFGRSLTDEQKKQKSAFAQYDAEINNWNLNQNMYKTNKGKVEIARKLGLRLIAVNDAHYGPREDYIWHELEWATTTGKGAEYDDDKTGGRGETAAWVMNDEEVKYWLMKSGLSEEIADEAIDNTGWVADHCNAVMERGMHPPRFESTREKDEELFDKTVVEGIKELVPKDRNTFKQYMDRVNLESELIKKCDLCGYFNTVADYANFVRAEDPDGEKYGIVGKHASLLGPGRGCFLPGNLVSTFKRGKPYGKPLEGRYEFEEPLRRIESIRIGQKVLTHDGSFQKVVNKFEYDVEDEECVEIVLSNGFKISCTADHCIYKEDDGFVRADSLKVGDILEGAYRPKENIVTECDECHESFVRPYIKYIAAINSKAVARGDGRNLCKKCLKKAQHHILAIAGAEANKTQSAREKNRQSQLYIHKNTDIDKKIGASVSAALAKIPEDHFRRMTTSAKKYKNGWFKSFKNGKEIYFASSFELKAIHIFETDSRIVSYDRAKDENGNQLSIVYNETHRYYPDFEVEYADGTKKIIEIKAEWQRHDPAVEAKAKAAIDWCNEHGMSYELWTEKELADKNGKLHKHIEILSIRHFKYTGKVYDLEVENVHNYTVGRTTVHNSAGGSIVCYLMHITNLDPIKFNLFFERFLTAGRVISKVHLTFDSGEEKTFEPSDVVKTEHGDKASWQCLTENWKTEFGKIVSTRFDFKDCPDIDLDFEARVIPQLNAYLKKRYGEYNFCQIGTFQTLKMPMAVKDLGKVKGMTPQETQDIVNRMENAGWPKGAYMRDYTFEDMMNCVNKDEELKKIQEETGLFDEVWHWGERYRGEGIHASGYVISKESMLGKLPLRMKDGKLITQFEHDGIASLGFIKYDILKLAGLGTIREVYERVNHKMDVKDIYRIMRDEKLLANADMWKSTWAGDTLGIFQMDTPLGMKTAINSKMASLRDAGMLSAVDRPGMVRSGLINEFYKVRQGIDPVNHYHPLIDSILDETSGFCVYQEQIMKIYATLCDMKIEETDNVRKVFTKKQTWNVEKMKTLLHDCCMSRKDFIDNVPSKYDSPEACFDDIWVGLSRTAEYCFNASHANAYGMITSIEQYFKWKYPSEFITASLNTDPGAVEFLTYAKVHGLKIAPPNVNKSKQNYELQDGVIYMPLSTVKGVGPAAVDEIIANGPYDSFDDYVQKTSGRGGRKKNVMESLISVGAFDGVDERDRFQLMVDWKKSKNEDYPTRNTWKNPRIRGKIEQNLLGISLSYDPLFDNKEWIEKQGVASLGELQKTDVGDFVCIPGQVTSIRKHQAKNGEMAWLTVKLLSHDEVTLTMFATAWSKYKDLISTNVIAAFNCKRTDDWNGKQSYVAFSAKANLEGEE